MRERDASVARCLAGVCITVVWLSSGCGSADSPTADATRSSTAASSGQTNAPSSELVGRWERQQTCEELVEALRSEKLDAVLPSVLTDWFPDATPEELARKKHPCRGATPRPHSHFFTDDGQFGSLDEAGQQVDEDPYQIVDDHTIRIGQGTFTYSIKNGDTLVLHPVIKATDRRQALAHPLDWNTAGWQAAVAWGGLAWKRVDCDSWC